jgi:hypothetical protein
MYALLQGILPKDAQKNFLFSVLRHRGYCRLHFLQQRYAIVKESLTSEKFELLQKTLAQRLPKGDTISDVYTGEKYKDLVRQKILGKINSISFNLFFDGYSRSKKYKIWPVWASSNEFPSLERMKAENLFLVGMWFQKGEPSHSVFTPLVHHINHLSRSENELIRHFNKNIVQTDDGTLGKDGTPVSGFTTSNLGSKTSDREPLKSVSDFGAADLGLRTSVSASGPSGMSIPSSLSSVVGALPSGTSIEASGPCSGSSFPPYGASGMYIPSSGNSEVGGSSSVPPSTASVVGDSSCDLDYDIWPSQRRTPSRLYQGEVIGGGTLAESVPLKIQVVIYLCVTDLPGRAKAMNFIQFNGKYGCVFFFTLTMSPDHVLYTLYDSLGDSTRPTSEEEKLTSLIVQKLRPTRTFKRLTLSTKTKQPDFSSCGFFICKMVQYICENPNLLQNPLKKAAQHLDSNLQFTEPNIRVAKRNYLKLMGNL